LKTHQDGASAEGEGVAPDRAAPAAPAVEPVEESEARLVARYADELKVSGALHPEDMIYDFLATHPGLDRAKAIELYFVSGRDSAEKLRDLLGEVGFRPDQRLSLLEFASGFGCVSRHLRHVLPRAKVLACDIHSEAIRFVWSQLHVKAQLSSPVPEALPIDRRFDVVFALSFFSHVPPATWGRWLSALYRRVAPGGVLIFTTHGSTSAPLCGGPAEPEGGIWFHPVSEQKDLDGSEYGTTVVTPEYVEKQVRERLGTRIHLRRLGYWWQHQDLYVVRRKRRKPLRLVLSHLPGYRMLKRW
jgi:SAM-dependent methyltransferase